jgi:hypothetical protein
MSEVETTSLKDSKFYELARSVILLQGLVPDLPTQMQAEIDVGEQFPRDEDDKDSTRILINYTNLKGNSTLFKLNNFDRYDNSSIDIDDFLLNYDKFMDDTNLPDDPVIRTATLVLSALTFAVSSVLGLDESSIGSQGRALAVNVINAVTTILYDDPLDVLIVVKEIESSTEEVSIPTIAAMWMVKHR